MKRLLLARHGETDWNRSGNYQGHADIPLNAMGRAQANALAERLVDEKIATLYASDLLRASETASIVGERIGLEPSFDEAWREMNVGSMTGIHHAEAPPHLREFISAAARSEDPVAPGAESFAQMESRLRTAYDQLTGETALIIGHGGTLKVLISMLIGLPPQNIDRLSLRGNTSLTEISFAHGRPQLVMINDTRHHS